MEMNSSNYSSNSHIMTYSLNLNNIPTFSQVLLPSPVTPVQTPISAPQGYISIFENMYYVFLEMYQNFSRVHKSALFDYYLSSCNSYVVNLSNFCQSLVPAYPQYILISLRASWNNVDSESECGFIEKALNQLRQIIQHSWNDLRDVISSVIEHIRAIESYLESLQTYLSLNNYYNRAINALQSDLRENPQLQQHLHFYLFCLQFSTDLKRSHFAYVYPSLQIWDRTNGVEHLQQVTWQSISKLIEGHACIQFHDEMKSVYDNIRSNYYYFNPSEKEDTMNNFYFRVSSFFAEAARWVATASKSVFDAANQRYLSEYRKCSSTHFVEQSGILQSISVIADNYKLASNAKKEGRMADVSYIISESLSTLTNIKMYEKNNHICNDTVSGTYKLLFSSLLK